MEAALRINGHGALRQYSRDMHLSEPVSLADVLGRLELPGELRDSVIALKDHRILFASDPLAAGDVVDLFIQLCGG